MTSTIEEKVDSIVAGSGLSHQFVLMDTSKWMSSLEAALPFRLPPSFLALVRRYQFSPIECSGVAMFGNVDGMQRDDLAIAVFRDATIKSVTQRNGFVQVGRPDTGSNQAPRRTLQCHGSNSRTFSGQSTPSLLHEQWSEGALRE